MFFLVLSLLYLGWTVQRHLATQVNQFKENKNKKQFVNDLAIEDLSVDEHAGLYKRVFDSAPDCVKIQKQDGTIEKINRVGLALLETEQSSSILGKSIYDMILPQYQKAFQTMSDQVFQGRSGFLEFEISTLQGNRRWVRTNAQPLRDANQKIIKLIAITYDITDNKLISQQLESHRNKLKTIIESEPECVKLQNAKGIITEMNPAGLSLLDADRSEDVVGKTIYDFITPEYVDDYRDLTKRVFEGGHGSMEFEVFCLNGNRRWMKTHAAPLFDSAGNVSSLLAITRNIDERKKNEARLYQQQIELARVCRLSTMGEMSSSLAHELNQPLCAVSSYAESARQLNLLGNPDLDSLLDKIVSQSWRATQIIKNMRDFVRKQTPQPDTISPAAIIKTVLGFVEPERRRENIKIELDLVKNLPLVNADPVQIEQVLLNLISNAMQSMLQLPVDQRKLTLQVVKEFDQEVLFKVYNAGPGISDAIVKELFTPFYTTKATGLGMGLSISRSIVDAHGGDIWYKYEPDYGPCFSFTLPAVNYE